MKTKAAILCTVVVVAAAPLACGDYQDGTNPVADDGGVDSASPLREHADSGDEASAPPDGDAGSDATADVDAGYPFKDPSFQVGPPWTTSNGASIDPKTQGVDDLGIARLGGAMLGAVAQTITTTPLTTTMHPAVRVRYHAKHDSISSDYEPIGLFSDGKPLFDSVQLGIVPTGEWDATRSFCVGEAFFGGPHVVEFRALDHGFSNLDLDHVELVEDSSCPSNLGIVNGDAEGAGGWRFSDLQQSGYHSGTGVGGSRSIRLGPVTSNGVVVTQDVLIPETSMMQPALSFHRSGAGTITIGFHDDEAIFAQSTATTDKTETICLPRWLRGTAGTLSLGAGRNPSDLDTDEVGMTVDLDDIRFVNEPNCANVLFTENRDFENPDVTIPGWYAIAGAGYSVTRGTSMPHGGSGYLALGSTTQSCGTSSGAHARASQPFLVASTPTGGARVRFFYRLLVTGTETAAMNMIGPLEPTSAWTEKSMCVGDHPDGARRELEFDLYSYNSGCEGAELDVDDIVIDTDPSCPRE